MIQHLPACLENPGPPGFEPQNVRHILYVCNLPVGQLCGEVDTEERKMRYYQLTDAKPGLRLFGNHLTISYVF
jgi:hypothetical protein